MIPEQLRDLPLLVEILMALGTLAGLWWGAVRWLKPKLADTAKALIGLMSLGTQASEVLANIQTVTSMQGVLQDIKHEVLPNGSGSLRDAVTRTECKVNLLVGQRRAEADANDDTASLDADDQGRVEWLSRALMIWTQRTSDELKGFGWISSIHPDEREDVAEEWTRCVRHRRQFDAAFRVVDRDGDEVLVRMSGMPVSTINPTKGEENVRWVATMRRINGTPPSGLAAPERHPAQSRQRP